MPRWTESDLRNYEARHTLQNSQPEPVVRHEPLEANGIEKENTRRIAVRIKSCRQRLLDPDNLVGGTKFLVDGLRYAGILHSDAPDKITLEVTQEKVKNKNEERTEIEII